MTTITSPTKKKTRPDFRFRQYQVEDLARLAMHDGAVLAWDPGLFKTGAGFVYPQVKGAKMTLIVAPEQLHEQICDEARDKFKIAVRPLRSVEDFYKDDTLRKAALEETSQQPVTTTGWWITSYSALGYNGGDMWEPKETEAGHVILNKTIIARRQAHPAYRAEWDYGIGKKLLPRITRTPRIETSSSEPSASSAVEIVCCFYPTLALLVSQLFDCVVCDEGVRLKSDESYCSLGVRMMAPKFRLVLTATPIKNRLPDIFWLCQWACGGHAEATARWPYENTSKAKENFANEHMLMEQNHTREAEHVAATGRWKSFKSRTSKICNIHRLWKLLGPVVLRRRKDDIGEAIVPKTIVPIRVKPGTAQQAVYKFHVDNRPQIAKNGNEMNPIAGVVAQLQNLRQAALCPDTENLSSARLSVFGLRQIIKTTKNPNADETQTHKAELVARKGDATPFPEEAKVALTILERMAEGGKIDLEKIIAAAPSFEERLRPFMVVQSSPNIRSWTDHSPKQAAILKLIQELISKGEQVAVMSPFQHFSLSLHRRLVEAGVSVCLLDGNLSPKKRGQLAKEFKRQRFAVMIGGIQSMGEGHSFECCSNLILPSIEWAFDKNRQAEDRVHRLTSPKPVTIYCMVTTNTIDERLASVYAEKKDSSNLALDGQLFADKTDDINLGQLLSEAIRNFDPTADTIDEKKIEEEWEGSLKQKLRIAEQQFREWHPPIVPDGQWSENRGRKTVTMTEIRAAAKAAEITPVVSLVKCIPSATFAALIGDTNIIVVEKCRELFTNFCATHPEYKDWRRAWSAFEPVWGVERENRAATHNRESRIENRKSPAQRAKEFIDSL